MMTATEYPHVSCEAGERPRLSRHPRVRVSMLVTDHLERGWSAEEIVYQYPELGLNEVHSALAFYWDNQELIDRELAEDRAMSELPGESVHLRHRLGALKRGE